MLFLLMAQGSRGWPADARDVAVRPASPSGVLTTENTERARTARGSSLGPLVHRTPRARHPPGARRRDPGDPRGAPGLQFSLGPPDQLSAARRMTTVGVEGWGSARVRRRAVGLGLGRRRRRFKMSPAVGADV